MEHFYRHLFRPLCLLVWFFGKRFQAARQRSKTKRGGQPTTIRISHQITEFSDMEQNRENRNGQAKKG